MSVNVVLAKDLEKNTHSCGAIGDSCHVSLGEYNVSLPNNSSTTKEIPAVLFFHGAGRSGEDTLKNTPMIKTMNDRGYAVIAPSGLKRPNSRFGPGWSFIPGRQIMRDELAFTRELLDDAFQRFAIDRNRVLMSGFSIGGSLVWYLACQDASIATAYAPVAGAFWRPHPTAADCMAPVKLMHTHGWRDKTVPLEGRPLGGGAIYQGDVFQGMQIMRRVNNCAELRADEFDTTSIKEAKDPFWQRWWTRCTPNSNLRLVLHTGGHSIPKGWTTMALNWFERVAPKKTELN
ncbi:alpha/beta hydrolase family esterase [Kiloniella antarctica]|uniref:Alpha/beta hydrolase family esterase n=1 Tax=Kiloniella antarctica TaxID=1550907 RepID=A0ABW5BQ79_9PROT